MAEFSELLRKRRSIREFEDREVASETIEEIIKESCLAPSSGNGQPWKFVIVNSKEWLKKLSDESKKNLLADIEKDPGVYVKRYEEGLKNEAFNVYYDAPCLVFLCGVKGLHSLKVDCSLAACYFMFAAAAKGLGTCWIGLGSNIRDPELLGQLGISEDLQIVAPLILGYPKNIPEPPERKAPEILKVIT